MIEKEEKVEKMPIAADYKVADLEREMPNPNRVALSKIRDTKEWIPLLEQYSTIEVISGVDTVAQISVPNLVPSLIKQIKLLEQELMDVQLNNLYSHRVQETQPLTGDKLALAASDYLDELLDTRGSQVND
ncbi:hypothetical protein [Psychrobacillus sp. L4]|uniref:hypothetical protein n=1 Tax=Psychrobacillus sp. L4 TaxID=3236892 RepID=UPI0036F266D1